MYFTGLILYVYTFGLMGLGILQMPVCAIIEDKRRPCDLQLTPDVHYTITTI